MLSFPLRDSVPLKKAEMIYAYVLCRPNMRNMPLMLAIGNRKLLVSLSDREMTVSAACLPKDLSTDRNIVKVVIFFFF